MLPSLLSYVVKTVHYLALLYGRALAGSTEPFFPRGFRQFYSLFYLLSAFHLHFHFGFYFRFCFSLFQLIIYQFILSFLYFFVSFYFIYSRTLLFGLSGTESHLDMQKIQIIGFFFENRLHWQFEVWLLLFTLCTFILPFDHT